MSVLRSIVVLALVAVAYGIPMPQSQPSGQNLVPGVFIPADAFKNLQDRANANDRINQQPSSSQVYQPSTNPQQVYQPSTNPQPTYQPATNPQPTYQPATNPQPTYQPVTNPQPTYQPVANQPQYNNIQYQQPTVSTQQVVPVQPSNLNNQPVLTNQPVVTNQAQPLVADRIGEQNGNQPTVVLTNQPNPQPNQVIYVQQPMPSQQTIYVPQNQPQQPSQGVVLQNGQVGQPTNVIIANPSSGNQPQGQNPGTVYTLIPLNGQNSNSNGGSYLIQSGNSNPIVLSTGK
ncbi:uncharacterized protein LOC142974644 [Anticarsia gemmatalis]|uniref:uncharacterized protein LOC142974644 n=1 Tax=Anticarsia gemmatalis TaxID=129554 RepID=UPI003F76C63F